MYVHDINLVELVEYFRAHSYKHLTLTFLFLPLTAKLVPVGYGIKKLQIMMTIVDDLVSVDNVIEEYLTVEPINEYVQSCDIVAFNKI